MDSARKIHSLLTPAERRSALVLLGFMVIGMGLETLGIGLVIPVIALLMQSDLASSYPLLQPVLNALGNPTHAQLLFGGMLALGGIYLVKTLFLALLIWLQMRFAFSLQAGLSARLLTTYLRRPYTFHLQRNSAQLIRNVITEISEFTFRVLIPGMQLLTEGLVVSGILILLLVVELRGALVVLVVVGGASWGFHLSTRARILRWGLARQHHEGLRIQHLHQGLGAIKDIILLGREREFLGQYGVHNAQSARVAQYRATLLEVPRLWLELLSVVGLILLVVTMLASARDMAIIVPTLGLFSAGAFRLLPSVNRMLGAVQSLRYGLPVINILDEELKLAAPEPTTVGATNPALQSEIQLVRISYTYPSAPLPALNGLSFSILKGECVGFIGPSGSGKSTLVDVILGLLTPDAGQVRVGGQEIQQNLRAWQDQIGYVPQSIYLTDDTLRRNVAFGLPNEQIDDAAVRRAIKAAQLEDFVAGLPDGLDTLVGERGIRISGGQRQRIGIARALYHDPAVLVLDEATSALDTATERGVLQAITALKRAKTILIVAHRLSTVEHCDRLYRLEHGTVAVEGPAPEMLRAQRLA